MTKCKTEMTVQDWAALPNETRLQLMEAAAQMLALGETRAQVRSGEHWVTYHPGNLPFLQREISRLRAITGKRSAITIERTPTGYPMPGRFTGRGF